MTEIRRAVVLAAGLGRRMRPLTDRTPKPLLRLGGRTLLDHVLDRLHSAGVQQAIVNAHWCADQIAAHLKARRHGPDTMVMHEPDLLDTAGTVEACLAQGLVGPDETIFIVNADTVWLDGPRPALDRMRRAVSGNADGVLLVQRTFQVPAEVGRGDFFVDKLGAPRRRNELEIAPYIYAGVTLASPALLALIRGAAPPLSMNALWDRAMAAGRLRAVVHDGLWFHLTRPADLEEAEHLLAAQVTVPTT